MIDLILWKKPEEGFVFFFGDKTSLKWWLKWSIQY